MKFIVDLERDYVLRERASIEVEANTPDEALRRASASEEAGLYGSDWQEHDGYTPPGSYSWEVSNAAGEILLEGCWTPTVRQSRGRRGLAQPLHLSVNKQHGDRVSRATGPVVSIDLSSITATSLGM